MIEYTENEIKVLALFASKPDFLLHTLILKRVGKIMETLREQKVVVLSEHCAYTQPLAPGVKGRIRQVLEGCGVIITGGKGGRGRVSEKLTARLTTETPCEICGVFYAEWTASDGTELCPECRIEHMGRYDLSNDDYKELPF